jgi:hypothetical protein
MNHSGPVSSVKDHDGKLSTGNTIPVNLTEKGPRMKRGDDASSMPAPDFGPQFADVIHLRCPSKLPMAVKCAANRKMISASAYMREAIAARLRNDGVDLFLDHEVA